MRRSVEQKFLTFAGEPVTTYVFKQDGEVRLSVAMPSCEYLHEEVDDWLHGDGKGLEKLQRHIEEPWNVGGMLVPRNLVEPHERPQA